MQSRTRITATVLALGLVAPLAACGTEGGRTDADGVPVLTWYINPDAGGQAQIAAQCSEASEGHYRIVTSPLPRDAASQREQLARRLAARDGSIDIMSLDPPYIPELAEAGFLAPVPEDKVDAFSEDVVQGALDGASWRGELVSVPFWANTQLLWYRKSVAEAAGLDMTQPVTWEQIMDATADQDTVLAVQGTKGESLTVWINSLVASAGGQIIVDPEAPADEVELGLDSDAGRAAAEIIGRIGSERLGGAGLPTADENANMATFQSDNGGFMVNWPFIWPSTVAGVEDGTFDASLLEDIGWALYPQVTEGTEAATPVGGINLGVGAFSPYTDLAYEAIECIVEPAKQTEYFLTNGNPPASVSAYDDERIAEEFPMSDTIRASLEQAVPRPQTPFYNEVSTGLQETWHPPASVNPDTTPQEATELIQGVLRGERLL
ncbi:MAG: sugar ABC transporter substrate-binding protein [Cellulomonadaceae bacterium]